MWLELNVDHASGMGEKKDLRAVMINLDIVKKISSNEGATKLTFLDGETIRVSESYDKIKATINEELERSYKHEPPETV